jgi:transposase
MEACCGAHHLARLFAGQGHEVRLMPPEYVQPYVKAQKNDDRDAEAIAEAATRPTMRFVALKSEAQLDQQTLHRVRSRLVNSRTRLMNQLRAILLERGITAKGRRALGLALGSLLDDGASGLSPRLRELVAEMRREWAELDARIAALDREFVETARASAPARRLATIPGIGALNATALTAAVGEAEDFASARDLAAWFGLVPRQMTTGGKARLGGITKRGNVYLRTLLIHGARAALPGLSRSDTPLGAWLRGLLARAHPNVAGVALAAKLPRIAWAVLRSGADYDRRAGAQLGKTIGAPQRRAQGSAGGVGDGLTVEPRPGTLVLNVAHRRRALCEGPGRAKLHLGGERRLRCRIRWRRLQRQHRGDQLADGAGHTFNRGRKVRISAGLIAAVFIRSWSSSPGAPDMAAKASM